MKRSKFLVLALAVAVMLMGAGYAYWTQDLTIENSITTGELDVQFTNEDLEVDTYMDAGDEVSDVFVDADKYGLNVELYDAYPGANITVSFGLENTGTLAAYVRDFGINETVGDPDLVLVRSYSVLGEEVSINENYENTKKTLAQVLNDLNEEALQQGIFVEYDETVDFVFDLEIDPDAINEQVTEFPYLEENSEGAAISFTINATAHQYNATYSVPLP